MAWLKLLPLMRVPLFMCPAPAPPQFYFKIKLSIYLDILNYKNGTYSLRTLSMAANSKPLNRDVYLHFHISESNS